MGRLSLSAALMRKHAHLSALFELAVAKVPEPNSNINLLIAFDRFERDLINARCILDGDPTVEDVLMVRRNHHAWSRYWSERHPIAAQRALYRLDQKTVEAEIERTAQRARSILCRHSKTQREMSDVE